MALNSESRCGAAEYGEVARSNFAQIETRLAALEASLVPLTRAINTTAPLTGGGTLAADRTLAIPPATSLVDGYLTKEDWSTFYGRLLSPMTTQGDMIYGQTGGAPVRLAKGSVGQVLQGGTAPSWGAVTEANLSFTNVSTANASASQHGLCPKLTANATQYLNGEGNWATPAGTTNAYTAVSFTGQTSVSVTHNFGAYPIVQVVDSAGAVLVPLTITNTDVNTTVVTFATSTTGTILLTLGSPQAQAVKVVTNDYNILTTDRIVQCSVAGKTVTLPAAGTSGREFIVDNSSAGEITLASAGGTIQGLASQAIPSDSAIAVYDDGTNWRIY